MLALTLIERALLPERPAFFVTAGQRGGGKTTLVIMITLAALGRRAAAAAWSENSEERKKALFSYLRQSLACVVWDNIPRGAAISCAHIEAALTAPDISDRVLGVSQVETVPSTTVQIFTGNSITPRGDMASRSLMLALNVNRPDPENRKFAHADPMAWTQANRPKIVRALYTLLVAGALNRPKQQEAKTIHGDLDAETAELTAGLHLHVAEAVRIHVTRMRIEAGQHAIDRRFDELAVVRFFDVIGAHALEHVAEQIKRPVSVRCCRPCGGTHQECVGLRQQQRRHDADQCTEENQGSFAHHPRTFSPSLVAHHGLGSREHRPCGAFRIKSWS